MQIAADFRLQGQLDTLSTKDFETLKSLKCNVNSLFRKWSLTWKIIVIMVSAGNEPWKSYFSWLIFGISNGLKRIQTPHSLCCDFGGYKTSTTRWSGGRVQVWVQVWAPACHLAISLKGVPEDDRRFRGQNQLPSPWGALRSACAVWTGEHKHRVFPILQQSLRAATGSLEESMLALLLYWLGSRVNKV